MLLLSTVWFCNIVANSNGKWKEHINQATEKDETSTAFEKENPLLGDETFWKEEEKKVVSV